MNQFLTPVNVDRMRYRRDHNEHECDEDYGDNGDAYDSAYTKYYDDQCR
jgi:hypothetical protein